MVCDVVSLPVTAFRSLLNRFWPVWPIYLETTRDFPAAYRQRSK